MHPTMTFGSEAEVAYRRERISHDFHPHGSARGATRRHGWHRRVPQPIA